MIKTRGGACGACFITLFDARGLRLLARVYPTAEKKGTHLACVPFKIIWGIFRLFEAAVALEGGTGC